MKKALIIALIRFIDARIAAHSVQHSCGPHVAAIREGSRQAERELYAAAGVSK